MDDGSLKEIALELERIVPENLSVWPPYAQAQHLQSRMMLAQLENLSTRALAAEQKADAQAKVIADQDRRLRFLEGAARWALGLVTAIAGGLGINWLASGGKHL